MEKEKGMTERERAREEMVARWWRRGEAKRDEARRGEVGEDGGRGKRC